MDLLCVASAIMRTRTVAGAPPSRPAHQRQLTPSRSLFDRGVVGPSPGWGAAIEVRACAPAERSITPHTDAFDICNGQQDTDLSLPGSCEREISIEGDFAPPPEG
jgi:hypothetical protein